MTSDIPQLVSLGETIFSSRSMATAFLHLLFHGAVTSLILQSENGMDRATAYRVLQRLHSLGLIYPALRTPKSAGSKRGPRVTVWAIQGARDEEIAEAVQLHLKKMSPKYLVAERVAQTLMNGSLKSLTEVTYREILIHVKEMGLPYRSPDIADLVAQYLSGNGVKVWR